MSKKKKKSFEIISETAFHIAVVLFSGSLVFFVSWGLEHWQDSSVVASVLGLKIIFTKYDILIKVIAVILTVIFFEALFRFLKHYKRGSISIASGIFYYRPNSKNRHRKRSEKFLKKAAEGCSSIMIFSVTGWNTFGEENSPLHKAIKKCHGAQILLAYPLSHSVALRAHDLHLDINNFKNEIFMTITLLDQLRRGGQGIELKMYESDPLWKFIVSDQSIWVQQYPKYDRVKNAPSCAFEKTSPEGDSIYDHLYRQCITHWSSLSLGTYNFETGDLEFRDKYGHITSQKSLY